MVSYYSGIKLIHIACVVLSGCLFSVRGVLMLSNRAVANHRILKRLSYVIDTTLLMAAILLTIVIHQYPFIQGWLTVKVLLLLVYIVLGMFALRRGKTLRSRAGFFAAALAVYAFIISVAVMHNPRGWFASPNTTSSTYGHTGTPTADARAHVVNSIPAPTRRNGGAD